MKKLNKYTGNSPGAQHIGENEFKYLKDIVTKKSPYRYKSNNNFSYCDKFEKKFSKFINKKYSLLVSSGTAAIHCALATLKFKNNDEIILPAYGWSADLMGVIYTKFKPVFCPIDDKLGLDPKKLKSLISKKTKAVIAIHMRGQVCDILEIKKICNKKNIFLLEDCSQCLGGSMGNKRVGSFGDVSTFSFQYNKLLTAGEGGLIATNDKKILEKMNDFQDLGMGRKFNSPDPVGIVHKDIGFNYHASDLTGGFLLGQFESFNKIYRNLNQNRNLLAKYLKKHFKKLSLEIIEPRKNSKSNNAFLVLRINNKKDEIKIKKFLNSQKIVANFCKDKDGHNFNTWMRFLKRMKVDYIDKTDKSSQNFLNKSLFIEISSLK